MPSRLGDRPAPGSAVLRSPVPLRVRPTVSISGVAASSRPAAAIAIARPGQALTAAPPCGGVIRARLTTSARTSPASAMPHPAYTRTRRRRASSAPNAGSTSPAVTQGGGSPGPPGLSSSSDSGRSRATASPGRTRPASPKNADGLVTRWKVHGMRMTAGSTATMAALIDRPRAEPGPRHRRRDRGDHRDRPGQRHEGRHDRGQQAGRPGRAARRPGGPGQHPADHDADQREQDDGDHGADPAGRHGPGRHREQRVAGREPDPRGQHGGEAPGGEERRHPGQRHAAEQQHVRGQPRLAAEQCGQDGHHADVGRRARGRADAGVVVAGQVLVPQAARAAPGRHQRAAAERGRSGEHRAGQRPLCDQRDHGQAGEEQDARAGEHAPGERIGGGQRQVVARLVHHGVVRAAAVVARPAGQHARDGFGQPAQRPAARQLARAGPRSRACGRRRGGGARAGAAAGAAAARPPRRGEPPPCAAAW